MDTTNFPLPYANQNAVDDAYVARGLLNIVGLFLEDAGPAGLNCEKTCDLLKVLDQARELLEPVCLYLQDQPSDTESYRQARRKFIVSRSKVPS